MRFKLLLVLAEDAKVDRILTAAREAGATGATVVTSARGETLGGRKRFLGLDLADQRDVILLVVEEHLCRHILERVAEAGRFDAEPGSGIVIQLAIEDALGLSSQMDRLAETIGEKL